METNTLLINNDAHTLSFNEMLILKTLYESEKQPLSQSIIIETCWPGRVVSPASLPVEIKHIRDVFKHHTNDDIILTHKGKGYSINKAKLEISISSSIPSIEEASDLKSFLVMESHFLGWVGFFVVSVILLCILWLETETHVITTKKDGVTYVSDFSMPSNFDKGSVGDTIYISHLDAVIFCGKNKSECYYEDDIY